LSKEQASIAIDNGPGGKYRDARKNRALLARESVCTCQNLWWWRCTVAAACCLNSIRSGSQRTRHKEKGLRDKGGETRRPLATTSQGHASDSEQYAAAHITGPSYHHLMFDVAMITPSKGQAISSAILCRTITEQI